MKARKTMANGHPQGNGSRVSETRFSLLEQRVGGIETALNQLTSKIDVWMTSRGQSSWRIVGFIAAILIPLAFVVNLYITSAISPWAAIANQAKATADSNASTMSRMMDTQTDILKMMSAEHAERKATEGEIETQFDADSQLRNVQWATLMRKLNDHQNALHEMGAKMPAASDGPFYFPNISNRNHRKQP